MENKSETESLHISLAFGWRDLSILMDVVFLSGKIYQGSRYQEQTEYPELYYLYDITSKYKRVNST